MVARGFFTENKSKTQKIVTLLTILALLSKRHFILCMEMKDVKEILKNNKKVKENK